MVQSRLYIGMVARRSGWLLAARLCGTRALLVIALVGIACSTLGVYPHELAYFNECSGGPDGGFRHFLGSNLDWGQDLLPAVKWAEARGIQTVFPIYHGGYVPETVHTSCTRVSIDRSWILRRNVRRSELERGFYLVSLTPLVSRVYSPSVANSTIPNQLYEVFRNGRSDERFGYTIFGFSIDDAATAAHDPGIHPEN